MDLNVYKDMLLSSWEDFKDEWGNTFHFDYLKAFVIHETGPMGEWVDDPEVVVPILSKCNHIGNDDISWRIGYMMALLEVYQNYGIGTEQ